VVMEAILSPQVPEVPSEQSCSRFSQPEGSASDCIADVASIVRQTRHSGRFLNLKDTD
jgi:hypothetical protein